MTHFTRTRPMPARWSKLQGDIHRAPDLSVSKRLRCAQEKALKVRKAKGITPSMPKFSWEECDNG